MRLCAFAHASLLPQIRCGSRKYPKDLARPRLASVRKTMASATYTRTRLLVALGPGGAGAVR